MSLYQATINNFGVAPATGKSVAIRTIYKLNLLLPPAGVFTANNCCCHGGTGSYLISRAKTVLPEECSRTPLDEWRFIIIHTVSPRVASPSLNLRATVETGSGLGTRLASPLFNERSTRRLIRGVVSSSYTHFPSPMLSAGC